MKKRKSIILNICGWVLFVLIVCVIIGSFLPTQNRVLFSPYVATERVIIPHLRDACEAYKKEYAAYPVSLKNSSLVKTLTGDNPEKFQFTDFNKHWLNSSGEIIDGWGMPLKIEESSGKLLIMSAGPDKIFGTKDDINELHEPTIAPAVPGTASPQK